MGAWAAAIGIDRSVGSRLRVVLLLPSPPPFRFLRQVLPECRQHHGQNRQPDNTVRQVELHSRWRSWDYIPKSNMIAAMMLLSLAREVVSREGVSQPAPSSPHQATAPSSPPSSPPSPAAKQPPPSSPPSPTASSRACSSTDVAELSWTCPSQVATTTPTRAPAK